MTNEKELAQKYKDILTVCLAKAIHCAMASLQGENWFAAFSQADSSSKANQRVTKKGQHSVQDMDLQGLLKILRHREAISKQVLTFHGFYDGLDDFGAQAQLQQFNSLLDRLVNDFRNRIEAHSRASDIERELAGQQVSRIYGYQEAAQDMLKLAQVFSGVTDSAGVSYYRRMQELKRKKKRWLPLIAVVLGVVAVAVAAVLLWPWDKTAEKEPPTSGNVFYDSREPVRKGKTLQLQPTHIYYDGDELVAICYVINGTDDTASGIRVSRLQVLDAAGGKVAEADFGLLDDTRLEPMEYTQWTFRFPAETVMDYKSNLKTAQIAYEIK